MTKWGKMVTEWVKWLQNWVTQKTPNMKNPNATKTLKMLQKILKMLTKKPPKMLQKYSQILTKKPQIILANYNKINKVLTINANININFTY